MGTVVIASQDAAARTRQVEAVRERLSAVVRDARGIGIEAKELDEFFEDEKERYYGKE